MRFVHKLEGLEQIGLVRELPGSVRRPKAIAAAFDGRRGVGPMARTLYSERHERLAELLADKQRSGEHQGDVLIAVSNSSV